MACRPRSPHSKKDGVLSEGKVASFSERQRLVDKGAYDAMEVRYAAKAFE